MSLNDGKAGMEGLNVDEINKVIEHASRGSKFYEHKRKSQAKIDERIKSMKSRLKTYTKEQLESAEKYMEKLSLSSEKKRDLSKTIVHIDMDAFYAAVEMRDNPALRDKPMAVGSLSMLSTSNYEARRFGVRAAMPGFIALKLCPHLTIVPCNFKKYHEVSDQIKEILAHYDPNFIPLSLDEAYLDITDYLHENEKITADSVAQEIRSSIFEVTSLTASAGIAPNAMLAKICSDIRKPNAQFQLNPDLESIRTFMNNLPVRKICGIGPVTAQLLNALGVQCCRDIWEKRGILHLLFSNSTAAFLLNASLGIGNSFSSKNDARKSISSEQTFSPTSDITFFEKICHELSERLENDLEECKYLCRSITLKLKLSTFEVKTRCKTLNSYIKAKQCIFEAAWSIFQSYRKELPKLELRLIGIRASQFSEHALEGKKDYVSGSAQQKTLIDSFNAASSSGSDSTKGYLENGVNRIKSLPAISEFDGENFERQQPEDDEVNDYLDDTQKVPCPICTALQTFSTINAHVDECLNAKEIQNILSRADFDGKDTVHSVGEKRSFTFENHPSKKLKTPKISCTLDGFIIRSKDEPQNANNKSG